MTFVASDGFSKSNWLKHRKKFWLKLLQLQKLDRTQTLDRNRSTLPPAMLGFPVFSALKLMDSFLSPSNINMGLVEVLGHRTSYVICPSVPDQL